MSLREPNVTLGPGQVDVRNAWHDMVGRIYLLRIHVDHAIQEGTRVVAASKHDQELTTQRHQPGFNIETKYLPMKFIEFVGAIGGLNIDLKRAGKAA